MSVMRGVVTGLGLALAALAIYVLSNLVPASGVFVKLENRLVDQYASLPVFPGPKM